MSYVTLGNWHAFVLDLLHLKCSEVHLQKPEKHCHQVQIIKPDHPWEKSSRTQTAYTSMVFILPAMRLILCFMICTHIAKVGPTTSQKHKTLYIKPSRINYLSDTCFIENIIFRTLWKMIHTCAHMGAERVWILRKRY